MSDMPMRLKYLKTKMKIILCIFLLCITAVSVFGQSVELNGIVGKSIEFPAKVETSGILMYGSKANAVIGYVSSGALIPLTTPEYQGRVHWDSSTGLFSLSELRLKDSGVYTVNNTNGKTSVSFHLTVWKDNVPVSKPDVSITLNKYPCTIECTAESGTGVTLSWYREGEKKPYVSSRVASAPHLHLPQTVERSGTYTCEAKNSVSRETSDPLTVGTHCTAPTAERELNSILAGSVKFPAAVTIDGKLMYGTLPIGDVTSGRFTPPRDEKFSGRVQWDRSTGLFSLSELKMKDSGVYTVQDTHQDINTVFQLNVYIPVSKPRLSVTPNESRCTILCAAARGTGATLTLYKNGEKNPYVTSPVRSHPDLDMTETVESGTYTCEAKNSVSRNTSDPLTVGAHCTVTAPANPSIWMPMAFFVFFLVVALFVYGVWRRFSPPPSPRTDITVRVTLLIFALIAGLIYFLHFSLVAPVDPSIWMPMAFFVFFLVVALFVYGVWHRFCHTKSDLEGTKNELEGTKNELEGTKNELEELRGQSKGNDEPETKKGWCPIS